MKKQFMKALALFVVLVTSGILYAGGSNEETAASAETQYNLPEGHPLSLWETTGTGTGWKIDIIEKDEIYVTDNLDSRIKLQEMESFVITSAGAIETVYMLGAEDRIAAIGTSRGGIWPEEQTAALPNVGNLARPSFEKIIAAEPDLVIINGMNGDLTGQIESVGIPVIIHNPDSINEIINSILVLGVLTGTEEKAVELVTERRASLMNIQKELTAHPLNLKGAFVYALEPLQAFSARSLPGEILDILGVENIAAGTTGKRPILTTEYILQQNPDFFFGAMSVNNKQDLLNADAAIMQTRAGREKNIYIVPSQLILRPSPRIIDALSMLHEKLKALEPASGNDTAG
jgi:iron complex transport system substrate-binding protein